MRATVGICLLFATPLTSLLSGCEVLGAASDAGLDAGLDADTGPAGDGATRSDAAPGPADGAVTPSDATVTPGTDLTYDQIPPAAQLTLDSGETHILPGRESTDPTDDQPCPEGQTPAEEVAPADTAGDLAIAVPWSTDVNWYFLDGRYNDSDFPVTQGTVTGLGDPPLPAYTIDPPRTHATDFLGTQHVVLYRFPDVADWRVYELAEGSLRTVAEVPAATVVADGYTRLPDLTANTDHPRTLVFAHADRPVSTFTAVGGGAEAARVADTPLGHLVQIRVPLPGAPYDTVDDTRGPSSWVNIYGIDRIFRPVHRSTGPGVVWQDAKTLDLHVTWLSDTHPGDFSTVTLPNIDDGRLAGADADPDGSLVLLLVQGGDGRPDTSRAVVALKTAPDGTERLRSTLDAGGDVLNVAAFEPDDRGNHATIVRSGNRIGVLLSRYMHRSGDGLNHQGCIGFVLDADTLALVGGAQQTSGHSWGNVLHANGPGKFLAADLGDNYPRGFNIHHLDDTGLQSRVIFTFKTLHGDSPTSPAGATYPIYAEASDANHTYYQWSNDNRTYSELAGLTETPDGLVGVLSTERSLLDNSVVGDYRNETRDLAMIRVRPDFENASAGRGTEWVTDDLVRSSGEPPVEGQFYTFGGDLSPQRVAGVVFLTHLGADESASRPKLHRTADGLLTLFEVWKTAGTGDAAVDTYVDTRALRLGTDGLPVGDVANLGRTVRLANRDDAFDLAGGTAVVEGQGSERRMVLTVLVP